MKQNPYKPPQANLDNPNDDFNYEYGRLRMLSIDGRLARLRYFVYMASIVIALYLIVLVLKFIPIMGAVIALLLYIAFIVVAIFLTIQRCHDFNMTGWLALLALIPLVSIVFYFIPGTQGQNSYGQQPPPNSRTIVTLAWIYAVLVALSIIGVIAAILIPMFG